MAISHGNNSSSFAFADGHAELRHACPGQLLAGASKYKQTAPLPD